MSYTRYKSNGLYLGLNFTNIKLKVKDIYCLTEDFNSIAFFTYNSNIYFTVNNIGELCVYYSIKDEYNINCIKNTVEDIIKTEIPDFKYIK